MIAQAFRRKFLLSRFKASAYVMFNSGRLSQALMKATGLTDLKTCLVSHCYDAQAVSLTFPTGFKFSYSGDCRPSKAFAEIGRDSTVLLHEATFDDELQGDAEAKKHSTMSEAIGVGLAMRAKRVILTHFSQRYQKFPVMQKSGINQVKLEDEEVEEPGVPLDKGLTDAAREVETGASLDGAETDNGANVESSIESPPTQQQHTQAEIQAFPPPVTSAPGPDVESTSALIRHVPRRRPSRSPSRTRRRTSVISIPASAAEEMRICVAFDYMKLKVKEIEHMEKLLPAFRELYKVGGDEQRSASAAAAVEQEMNKNAKRKKHQNKSNDKKPRRQDGDGKAKTMGRTWTRSPEGNLVEVEGVGQGQLTPQHSTISK